MIPRRTAAGSPAVVAVPAAHLREGAAANATRTAAPASPAVRVAQDRPPASVGGGPVLAGGFQARTWTLEFPPGMEILTANNRLSRYPKAGAVGLLRKRGEIAARNGRLPRIERADIRVTYLPPPRRKKDRHPFASARIEDSENLAPTGKALIDGIAQAGTFGGGDSRKHVRRVTYELLDGTCPRGEVTLHITEVTG